MGWKALGGGSERAGENLWVRAGKSLFRAGNSLSRAGNSFFRARNIPRRAREKRFWARNIVFRSPEKIFRAGKMMFPAWEPSFPARARATRPLTRAARGGFLGPGGRACELRRSMRGSLAAMMEPNPANGCQGQPANQALRKSKMSCMVGVPE